MDVELRAIVENGFELSLILAEMSGRHGTYRIQRSISCQSISLTRPYRDSAIKMPPRAAREAEGCDKERSDGNSPQRKTNEVIHNALEVSSGQQSIGYWLLILGLLFKRVWNCIENESD